MANWGAGSVVTISASNTTYVTGSSVDTITDSFSLPQPPRRINSSTLDLHGPINTSADSSIVMINPYTSDNATSTAFRIASTFNNAITKLYIPYDRRPLRGQVYPR